MATATSLGYACPRNRKFTYAGWLAHHTKQDWKVDPEQRIAFEYGTLPMDPLSLEGCWKVVKILRKFATNDIKARFSVYYDTLDMLKRLKAEDEVNAVDPHYVLPSTNRSIPNDLAVATGLSNPN